MDLFAQDCVGLFQVCLAVMDTFFAQDCVGLFRVCWAVMDLFLRRIEWDCSGYVGQWWTSFRTGLHGIVLVMYNV